MLKSKYLDKDKQKTVPLIHNNKPITLVQLCPEEKWKIGELIRALEQRKAQN